MTKICHSETSQLSSILDGKTRFVVPDYQREYTWSHDKEVEELWSNLRENYDIAPEQAYLLGPIVTVQKPLKQPHEIVDGQQRLVTLTLLFCALRDSLMKHKPESKDDEIDHNELINKINKAIKSDNQPIIKLNDYNDDISFKCICDNKTHPKSKTKIISNYDFLFTHIESLCNEYFHDKTYREGIRDITKFFDAIKDNTYFINIEITDEQYAYAVFQSLNSKGLKLTQAALIKSHLLSISTDNIKDRWDNIMTRKPIKRHPDDFLYYSMLSRECNEEILKNKMNTIMKKRINNLEQVNDYLVILEEDADIISVLNDPKLLYSSDERYANDFVHLFYGIKQINAKYFRRPIIAAYRKWKLTKETKSLVGCLLKFFFMHRTISKLDIDLLKRISKDITCQINAGKDLNEVLHTILKNKIDSAKDNIDQDRFIEDFKNNTNSLNISTITYILYSIEHELQEDVGVPMKWSDLQVEHIFPKKPVKDWNNKEELKDHTNRIGNLTLLDWRWNPTMKNRVFDEKMNEGKKCYKNSGLKLNEQHLKECKKWDVSEMEKREQALVEHVTKIWDLSEYFDMIKPKN